MPDADHESGAARQPLAFISHHSSQIVEARHMARILERNGIKGWLAPDDIEPGMAFDQVIIEQIAKCDVILLLFSARSDQSKHVKREVMLAEQHNKLIYPIRLESIQPDGLAYWLQDYQWIDWLDGRDEAVERMVTTIRRQLSMPELPPSSAPSPGQPPSVATVPLAQPVATALPAEPAAPVEEPSRAGQEPLSTTRNGKNAAIMGGGIGIAVLLTIFFVAIRGEPQEIENIDSFVGPGMNIDDPGVMLDVPGVGIPNAAGDFATDFSEPGAASSAMRPGKWQVRYQLTDYFSDIPGTSERQARAVVASYSGDACLSKAQVNDPGATVLTAFTAQLPNCQVESGGTQNGEIESLAVCLNPIDSLHTEVSAEGRYGPDTVNVEYDMSQWFEAPGAGQTIDSTITMVARHAGGC